MKKQFLALVTWIDTDGEYQVSAVRANTVLEAIDNCSHNVAVDDIVSIVLVTDHEHE